MLVLRWYTFSALRLVLIREPEYYRYGIGAWFCLYTTHAVTVAAGVILLYSVATPTLRNTV